MPRQRAMILSAVIMSAVILPALLGLALPAAAQAYDPNYTGACVPSASDVDCAGVREMAPPM